MRSSGRNYGLLTTVVKTSGDGVGSPLGWKGVCSFNICLLLLNFPSMEIPVYIKGTGPVITGPVRYSVSVRQHSYKDVKLVHFAF